MTELRKNPKPTEKGRLHRRSILRTQMQRAYKTMGKQMVILDFLMEADSVEAVNNESLSLERLHQEVCDANVQFVLFGGEEPSEEEIENDKEQQLWLQAVDEAFLEYKKRVCAWLIEKDKLQQQFSTTRGGARSRASSIVSSIKSQGSNLSHRSKRQ